MRRTLLLGAMGFFVTVGIVLSASPAECRHRDHSRGFLLRLSAGPGYAKSSINPFGDEIKVHGLTVDWSAAVGSVVFPQFAVYLNLSGWKGINPQTEVAGEETGTGSIGLNALGLGFTYFRMPQNVSLSGVISVALVEAEGSGGTGDTSNLGYRGELVLGREWWINDQWGLGPAFSVGYHNASSQVIVDDRLANATWSGWSYALRLTATLN